MVSQTPGGASRCLFFKILLTVVVLSPAVAQERIYWDFPKPVASVSDGMFPQVVRAGESLAMVWQEFTGESGSLEATIALKVVFSDDGRFWDAPVLTVAENLPYLWLEKVPLYSVIADSSGRLVIAVAVGAEGVVIYTQTSAGPDGAFVRSDVLPSGPGAADVGVAPRLARRPDGGLRLFLTRRTTVEGASRPSTLTIFVSESADGRRWSEPSLFVDPHRDKAVDGTALEQNFLPSHLLAGTDEYVVFQSLRQGDEGQVYQIYVKAKRGGGEWSAAKPVSEGLTPSRGDATPLLWDNQRPYIGLSAEGDILVAWERRRGGKRPGIALARLNRNGDVMSDMVEEVVVDRYTSAFPSIFTQAGRTWILWFDDTGIRLARRDEAYNYAVFAASLDTQTPASDRGSAAFPAAVSFRGNTYLLWQDQSGGTQRTIFLQPDLLVDSPKLHNSNFRTDRPGNLTTLLVDWTPPQDSSGILSHSWLWSQDPDALPSKEESDQNYGDPRAIFNLGDIADPEGRWYFTLRVRDQAGNWSEPLRLSYILDLTPPPPPIVADMETDAHGYSVSNTFALEWDDGEVDPAAFYRWRMDYLAESPEALSLDRLDALSAAGADGTESTEKRIAWENLDNGVWAFSVAAVDGAGNEGPSNTKILLLNRYVPVTFITGVSASKDESDSIVLRIDGRGFSTGGQLTVGIIDRNAQEPWDYVFSRSDGRLTILSDRAARIDDIDEMEEGTYFIGVSHPRRGTVFWNRKMRLDSTGSVKFGPFGLYTYESIWVPAALSIHVDGSQLLLVILGVLIVGASTMTVFRLASIGRETRMLREDARALLERTPMSIAAREEVAALLRRKGMGLRNKFTLALSLLVIFTITMIAAVLGFVWLQMERDTLAEGLASESRLLVETLASSAGTSIPAADRGELLLLPDRIKALPDAIWATVTGPRGEVVGGVLRATSTGSEYIWASNDPDILDKIALPEELEPTVRAQVKAIANDEDAALLDSAYPANARGVGLLDADFAAENRPALSNLLRRGNVLPGSPGLGVNRIEDEISDAMEIMRRDVEREAQDAGIARMISELAVLEEQYAAFAQEVVRTLDFDNPAYVEAEAAVAAQRKEIETLLLEISSNHFAGYPEFNADALRPGGPDSFIFYKPLLYRVGNQDADFFRGTIRLAVSVDDIRESLARVTRRIIIITIIASAAALALGVLVALFIASLIVRPITSLVKGVSIIRDQPDMLQHEDFDVGLDTGDELAGLADTINGMVQGLVQAALEQKELVAGQEIQKTFLPLETGESGKKLSTGGARNAFFRLFGYYEGADAVSGDYFDFRRLDEDHYVMIKLDIAGHGVTASLIMVQVAALYVDYFRRVRDRGTTEGRLDYDLREFTFGINDLINEVGFRGRFAAFNLSVINVRTAEYEMINAGDNQVNIFKGSTRKLVLNKLPDGPAAGQIPSDLIEMNSTMYRVVKGRLERGDILFLFTDGIEEAHHIIRSPNFEVVQYKDLDRGVIGKDQEFIRPTYEYFTPREREGEIFDTPALDDKIDAALDDEKLRIREGGSLYKQIDAAEYREEFDTTRVREVIEAALNRGRYTLERRCDLTIGKPLHFDFSDLESSGENAVLALASVEKVFRIIPDVSGGSTGRVRVDKKIVAFLQKYFQEYDEFYGHRADEDEGYIYFSHLKEDPQDDDLTIWAYERL